MPRDARVETGALRLRLMAGAAAVALATWNGAAQAQDAPVVTAPQTPGADGLPPEAIYLEADTAARTGDLIRRTRIDGASVAEAAAAHGISETAAKVSIHRGLKSLAARFAGGAK